MPTYRVKSPDGRTLKITGDSPPTEAELESLFADLPAAPRLGIPAMANRQTSLTQGEPQGAWSKAWDSVRESIFGTPAQAEAEQEGAYTQPPPSRVAGAMLEGASMLGLGPAALAGVGGVAGRIGRFAAQHPHVIGAAYGAIPRLARGDVVGAVEGAGVGAGTGMLLRPLARRLIARGGPTKPIADAMKAELEAATTYRLAPSIREPVVAAVETAAPRTVLRGEALASEVKALMDQGKTAEAKGLIDAARAAEAAAPATAPEQAASRLKRPEFVGENPRAPENPTAYTQGYGPGQRPQLGPREAMTPAATAGTPAAPIAAPMTMDAGRAAVESHARAMAIAKQAALSNPKLGEKIWIRFKDGQPIEVISDTAKSHASDLAGAVNRSTKRTGESARWFKNLWGKNFESWRGVRATVSDEQ